MTRPSIRQAPVRISYVAQLVCYQLSGWLYFVLLVTASSSSKEGTKRKSRTFHTCNFRVQTERPLHCFSMQHTRREIFEKDTRMNQTTISKRHDPVHSVSVSWLRLWLYFFLLVTALGITVAAVDTDTDTTTTLDHSYDEEIRKHLELFHYSEMVQVIGPSRFPAPTEVALVREEETTTMIVPYLQPIAGHHRPSVDVVVAFAAEYPLSNYVTFIESLRATGFTGDVVLAISPLDQRKTDVWEYLTEPNNHVVLYAPVLVCYNAEGEAVDSAKGGSRVCKADHLFAQKDRNTGTVTPIPDPRPPRTVQTLRYEIYWLMIAFHTNPHAWILLVDARDTIFQTNPFASVPRRRRRTTINTNNSTGTLYFFGENVEATRLGRSASNRKWLQAAYGTYVADILADKPTVCSGATLGEQIALETYVRAMVAESDHTGTVLAGADQGFHNFLHYSHKLKNADTIDTIVVFDQGQGIVNNMGALRTKPLSEWGNGKLVRIDVDPNERNPRKKNRYTVLNWDGTVSPVVHQFDRHKELSDYFFKVLGNQYMDEWNARKQNL